MKNSQKMLQILLAGMVFVMGITLPGWEMWKNILPRALRRLWGCRPFTVNTFTELRQAVTAANEGTGDTTILLEDGTYQIPSGSGLYVTADNVTLRSLSGQRENVIIQGLGMEDGAGVSHGVLVGGSNFILQILPSGTFAIMECSSGRAECG